MEKISEKINKLYQKLYFLDEHPFYQDLNEVKNIDKNFINYKNKKIKEKVKFNFKKEIPKSIKFTETCVSENAFHTNEYYVLPKTDIVLKSKQWISETNGYIVIYNYYAFQKNLFQ